MKHKLILLSSFFVLLAVASGFAQDSSSKKQTREAKISQLINSKRFDFITTSATPMSGRTRQLTSAYNLRIKQDTVEADLPYFGRAYVAPINQTEGGISFKATGVKYDLAPAKKGGWDLAFTVAGNNSDKYQVNLHITASGYGTLRVNSLNRQPISFNGNVQSIK